MSGSKKIGNYIVSDTKNGIIINDKNGDWQVKFATGTQYYLAINHYMKNGSEEELGVVFNVMFYATATCVTDFGLVNVILNYFNEKTHPEESTVLDDEKDLKIVKENQKHKEDEQDNDGDK